MKRVHLFATCLSDAFFPESALAAAEVLEDAGFRVDVDPAQTCCGQPAMNLGHRQEARALARQTIELYADDEAPVVVPSGSCAAMMRLHYSTLFAGLGEQEEAEAFSSRVVEWSRFLVEQGYRPPRAPGMLPKVSLHPSCHGLRELGIQEEPRRLLEAAGFPLVGLPRAEECCGFGGAFSVALPEISGAILQEKLANVKQATDKGARVVASLDAGCLMHMRGGQERADGCREGEKGCPRYRHVAELLAQVVRGQRKTGETSAKTQGDHR